MDLVLKLREIRRLRGLSQKDVARMSGVGEKTISSFSSFETGQRIGSLKLSQLNRMLDAYGLTESEFFCGRADQLISDEVDAAALVADALRQLPKPMQSALIEKMRVMLDTATALGRYVR